jgi:Rrf2 family protein
LTPARFRNSVSYMKRSNRLSVALHVLVHLATRSSAPMTSEQLAACVRTNPVVIRRTLAGLREAGLVTSMAGHGGGWSLARDPARISLGEVCAALGERLLFAVDLALRSGCQVQVAVSGVLDGFLRDAEALLLDRLGGISLADLAAQVQVRGGGRHSNDGDPHVR